MGIYTFYIDFFSMQDKNIDFLFANFYCFVEQNFTERHRFNAVQGQFKKNNIPPIIFSLPKPFL